MFSPVRKKTNRTTHSNPLLYRPTYPGIAKSISICKSWFQCQKWVRLIENIDGLVLK